MKKLLSLITLLFICSFAFSQISLTSTVTNASCFGLCNGTASITATGGTAPYTFWSTNGANAPVISNLCAGQYTVYVLDATSTKDSIAINITQPTPLNSNVSASPACNGVCSATANVNSFGGTAPYQYSWSDGSITSQVPNLCAGTYTVQTLDANNCSIQNSVTVISYSINLAVTSTSALCNGTPTGTINITSTIGGSAPFLYNLNGGSFTSSPIFTNVFAGIYTTGVRDANGCIGTQTVFVAQPNQLITSITSTNTSCGGVCDGAFNIIATGATAPYTFSSNIGPCTAFNTSQCAGTQTITITDANNCVEVRAITITQPTSITAVISATNSNCGQTNGALCASVTGGSGITSNLWSNGNTLLCNSNIPAGAYTFTVTDSNGCTANASGLVNDIAGPVVSVTSQTNIPCFGLMTGAATTTLTGGVSPYTFSWSGAGTSTTSSISNAGAGIHNLTVTDTSGCIGTVSVNITQPTQLIASINNWSPACYGSCTGYATANVIGGTPVYSYAWTGGGGNSAVVTNLCAGNYGFTVTDVNGCTATSSVTITQPPAATISVSYTNATCSPGICNGIGSVSFLGGTGQTTYLWFPGLQTGSTVNTLCAGVNTVTITNNGNCVYTETFVIANQSTSPIPNASLSSIAFSETCLQTGDGAIDLSITGSNPGPFTYQWDIGSTTQDISNLNSGIYSVAVFDASMNCLVISDTVNFDNSNCGSIIGNVYADNNSDCIKNSGDNNLYNTQIIANPGNRIGYTNLNGDYAFYNLPFGTYTIMASTNPNMLATCTTTLNTLINSGNPNSINNNFAKEYIPITQPDLYVSAYSNGIVPGFVCRANYGLHNYNTFNANGVFKVTLPSAFIPNITNAFPAAYTLSGDTIIWNFSNINYTGWNYNFYIDFITPLTTPLGSVFTTCMWAQPTATDLNYANNTYCYSRYVTGSFDPNDKTVSPLGIGTNGDISATETDLTYLIRFQNTGNGPAVNIYVKDTLSPNVDINTFEMLSSSHNYMIDVLPGNVLRWKFNNIMLPDSNSNEPGSHGYIQYRIKRTNNNTPGTQIKNTAYIYFDFNEPVVTNTAINTIETITGIKSSFNTNDEWNVFPNPSTGALYIVNSSSVKEESQIQVINSIGQTVLEETINNNYKNIDLSKLNNGVYFVKIVSDKQSVIKRVVLSK